MIDGVLSEDIWGISVPVTEFVQREPDNGSPATQKTEFYLLYDDNFLYIGVRCYDDPDKVVAKEMSRDADLSNDDRVAIILDTHLDRRNAYWFQIGPRGAIGDAAISANGSGFNREWRGLWEGKASIQSHGWEAELAIPFKTLNFNSELSTWGAKFIRYIRRNREDVIWPSANLNNRSRTVSDAGILHGIEGISQGVGLDINPYAILGHDHLPGENNSFMGNAGVDVLYQITPGLRSMLTLNTDFAETEADSRQVNLTRFSLLFPEKRDFFLDGASYFNFGIGGEADNPYSRRIIPFFSRRLGLDSDGEPLPVYAGTRFTGQAGKWNLGLMNMFQEKQYDNNNFTAMRVSRNIGQQSSAGMIATIGNAVGEGSNALYGLDAKIATSTLGGDKNLAFTTFLLQSVTENQGSRSFDNAFGTELNYPNDFLFGRTGFMQIDQDFTAGVGFVPRKGIREFYFSAGIGPRPRKWGILQISSMAGIDIISGLDGNLQSKEIDLTPLSVKFNLGEEITAKAILSHENLVNDFNLLGRILIPAGEYDFTTKTISFNSSRHGNLWGTTAWMWGDFYNGRRNQLSVSTSWKPFLHLFLGFELDYSFLRFPENNIDLGIYRVIVNVLFTPNINFFTFIQYDDISETTGWQSRFRWILKPGRELLLAWNSNIINPMDRFSISESSLRFKLKYNIRF